MEEHSKVIQETGAQAYYRNARLDECPFRFGTEARVAWKQGWLQEWEKVHPGKLYEEEIE